MWRSLGRWVLRVVGGLAALALLAFAVDWLIYVLRKSPQSSVSVTQFMSIPLKGQKTEYDLLGTADVACDVALFPHGGETPCWYLRRHPEQWENVNVNTPAY
jgi:hypothetical protein